jgi:phospholipid/cholesterol/gamma-HCH transport system substrate-binding protein
MKISREVKIGAFVVLMIASFIWGYSFLKGRNLLNPITEYSVVYDKIGGLEESNPVLINGYKVGQVSHIFFVDDNSGRLIVKIWLDKSFDIPKNSVAMIFSADLMGTKAIRIDLSDETEYYHPGDTLRGEIEGSLQEQVSVQVMPLKMKAENLLLSIDSVMAVVQQLFNEEFKENFSKSLSDIRLTIAGLSHSVGTIDTLMYEEKGRIGDILSNIESVSDNLRKSNKDLSNIMKNFSSISDTLVKANVRSTIENLNKSLEETSVILQRIEQGEGTLGELARNDTLYNNLQNATLQLELLLRDIRINPKKYLRFSLLDFSKSTTQEENPEAKRKKGK